MTSRRRQLLALGLAPTGLLTWASSAGTAARAPFRRLAVVDPPHVEAYEVLIAATPPLARGTVAKLLTRALSAADSHVKSDRLTAALDPDKTRLHEHFVQALAEALDEAAVKVVLVPVDAARDEDALVAQVRKLAPDADGVLLANVMGRFVALHGLTAYVPGVIVGIKAQGPAGKPVWLEQIYSAGFRGIDPRAEHLEAIDMPARFDDADALLKRVDEARSALIDGVEAVAAEVARRLMAA